MDILGSQHPPRKGLFSRNKSILNPDRDGLRLLDAYCCNFVTPRKGLFSRNMSILNPDRDGFRLLDAYCCNFVTLLVIIQLQGY